MSSHQQIVRLLKDLKPTPILDVGAAQGFLGQLLQNSGLTIDAIEPQPKWADHARPYYRNVYPCTVEEAKLEPGTYAAIVCADVLEHTADPVSVLKELRVVARPDALFIISVPNIAHLAVRLMLLAGKFPKMDRGILDRTHLQFLTKDTAIEMLRAAGLRVERISSTGVPLDEVFRKSEGKGWFNALAAMQRGIVRIWPRMFAMQWIFVARPE